MFFVCAMTIHGFPMPVGTMHESCDAAWEAFPAAEEKRSAQPYATARSELSHHLIVPILEAIRQTAPPQFARSPYLAITAQP